MKACKIALIRICCRSGNTILLTLIFAGLSVLLLFLQGFYGLIERERAEYERTVPGELVVRSGDLSYGKVREGYALNDEMLANLADENQGSIINKAAVAFGYADSFTVKEEDERGMTIQTANGMYSSRDEIPDISIMGILNSEKYHWFENHVYELIEGEHITEADAEDRIVLISLGLAQTNQLEVGSKIRITVEGVSERIELTVNGIFSAVEKDRNASRSNPENKLILPIGTFEECAGSDLLGEVVIQLSSAANVDELLNNIKNSSQVSLKNADVITNNYEYVKKTSILSAMQQYLKITIGTLYFSSLFVIGLYVIYQNMTRNREFKIFLARGAKKLQIFGELLTEVGIPCLAGMMIGMLLCAILFHVFGSRLSYQNRQLESLTQLLNIPSICFLLGSELIIIFLGNLTTLAHLATSFRKGI
ncbi:MAG: ABC transporter permease [Lachnospiraceae bacterium]